MTKMLGKTISEVVHETARDFYEAGVMSEQTMREFDALCLGEQKQYTPKQIREIRKQAHTSQAVFAAYLNTSVSTVQKWEQGIKKPSGIALRLLSVIERHGISILLK